MDRDAIEAAVRLLDTTGAAAGEAAWAPLRELGVAVVPYLVAAFPTFRTWQGRTALVFHAIRHARRSDAAFALGVRACGDRSYMVRYRACGLLAYAQRADAIPHLEPLCAHRDARTVADARAAIDAIRAGNHHYFVDRDHSHRSFWVVDPTDNPCGAAPA